MNYQQIENFEVYDKDLPMALDYDNAVETCKQLGDGWCLPTLYQINLIYLNKKRIPNLTKKCYWSSSPSGDGFGGGTKYWCVDFKNGNHKEYFERVELFVRPIRIVF